MINSTLTESTHTAVDESVNMRVECNTTTASSGSFDPASPRQRSDIARTVGGRESARARAGRRHGHWTMALLAHFHGWQASHHCSTSATHCNSDQSANLLAICQLQIISIKRVCYYYYCMSQAFAITLARSSLLRKLINNFLSATVSYFELFHVETRWKNIVIR